jgi:predicted site-specific integrase-resolvase
MPTEKRDRRTPDRRTKPPTKGQRLLTGQQVEVEYGLPYRTLYDWYLKGKLPAVRVDRRLRFLRVDVDKLLATNSITATDTYAGVK